MQQPGQRQRGEDGKRGLAAIGASTHCFPLRRPCGTLGQSFDTVFDIDVNIVPTIPAPQAFFDVGVNYSLRRWLSG